MTNSIRVIVVAALLAVSVHAETKIIPNAGSGGGGGDPSCELTGGADCIMTGPVRASDGTAALPSLTLASDTNTGLYSIGADQLGFSAGGTLRLTLSTTAVTSTLPHFAPLGSVSAASFGSVGSVNNGLYFPSTTQVAITADGTQAILFAKTYVQSVLPFNHELPIATHASSTTGTNGNSGSIAHNTGATASVVITLATGSGAVNTTLTYCVMDSDGFDIRPGASETIQFGTTSVTSATGSIVATELGACLSVVKISATSWITYNRSGTWVATP